MRPEHIGASAQGDVVASQWTRVGGGLSGLASESPVVIEELIADTARVARDEARLFWVAATWLAKHAAWVDLRRLRHALKDLNQESRAVAGALLSVAGGESPAADRLVKAAGPVRALTPGRPLFRIVEDTPELVNYHRAESLPLFTRWGLWQDDVSLKFDAVRPSAAILARCPELRLRAALGPGLEAVIVAHTLVEPTHAKALAIRIGATYAAVHDAAQTLVNRGVLQAASRGRAQILSPTVFGHELAAV